MRAQITLEYLTTTLIFIICIALITASALSHFTRANSILQKNSQTESLSIIAINLGILYTGTDSLSTQLPLSDLELQINENTLRSNEAFAYTINPGQGVNYAQYKDSIPQ